MLKKTKNATTFDNLYGTSISVHLTFLFSIYMASFEQEFLELGKQLRLDNVVLISCINTEMRRRDAESLCYLKCNFNVGALNLTPNQHGSEKWPSFLKAAALAEVTM